MINKIKSIFKKSHPSSKPEPSEEKISFEEQMRVNLFSYFDVLFNSKFGSIERDIQKCYRQQSRLTAKINAVIENTQTSVGYLHVANENKANIKVMDENFKALAARLKRKCYVVGALESDIQGLRDRIVTLTNELVTTKTIDIKSNSAVKKSEIAVKSANDARHKFEEALSNMKVGKEFLNSIPNMVLQKVQAMENRLIEKGI